MLHEDGLLERSRVDPHAERDPPVQRRPGYSLQRDLPPEISRVDPHGVGAFLERGYGQPVVEVDIGHERNRRAGPDLPETGGGLRVRDGHPRDFAPGFGQSV